MIKTQPIRFHYYKHQYFNGAEEECMIHHDTLIGSKIIVSTVIQLGKTKFQTLLYCNIEKSKQIQVVK